MKPIRGSRALRIAPLVGSVLVLTGLAIIWVSRSTVPYAIYVSQLGESGAPTARAFSLALLAIAAGGFVIAATALTLRPGVRWLAIWIPSVSLGAASACFVGASQVSCSPGCPTPFMDPASRPQDLIHTSLAVLGFALACFAMLQIGSAPNSKRLARFSIACGISVAAVSAVGGLLAIVQIEVDVGAWAEFTAMTIAIGWVAVLGVLLTVEGRSRARAACLSGAVDPGPARVADLQE